MFSFRQGVMEKLAYRGSNPSQAIWALPVWHVSEHT